MSFEALLFYAFGGVALLSALAMVGFVRNLVAGALSLVVTMLSLAGIYVLLEGHLVAAIQIIVYAGAILVLFLFVIMLLNLRVDEFGAPREGQTLLKTAGAALALAAGVAIASWLARGLPFSDPLPALPEGFGGYREVGRQLFGAYVVPVEAAGLLLLTAIVGAVILARRRID